MSIAVVVFDLGGVLVDFAGFEHLPKLLGEPVTKDECRRRWIASPSVSAFERGGLRGDEFAERFVGEWGLSVSPQRFLADFVSWAGDFYPGARELLAETRRHLPIACFSNTNPLHWENNFTAFGIPQSFDHAFASYALGAVKPEVEAFESVIAALGYPRAEILFLDDTEVNVAAALAIGMQARLVRGVKEARAALAAYLPDLNREE